MPQIPLHEHEYKELLGFKEKFLAMVGEGKGTEAAKESAPPLCTAEELQSLKEKAVVLDNIRVDFQKFGISGPDNLQELIDAKQKLLALEAAGVDNWSGYGEAMALLKDEPKAETKVDDKVEEKAA